PSKFSIENDLLRGEISKLQDDISTVRQKIKLSGNDLLFLSEKDNIDGMLNDDEDDLEKQNKKLRFFQSKLLNDVFILVCSFHFIFYIYILNFFILLYIILTLLFHNCIILIL